MLNHQFSFHLYTCILWQGLGGEGVTYPSLYNKSAQEGLIMNPPKNSENTCRVGLNPCLDLPNNNVRPDCLAHDGVGSWSSTRPTGWSIHARRRQVGFWGRCRLFVQSHPSQKHCSVMCLFSASGFDYRVSLIFVDDGLTRITPDCIADRYMVGVGRVVARDPGHTQ